MLVSWHVNDMVEQLYSVAEGDVIILTDIWLLVVTIVIKKSNTVTSCMGWRCNDSQEMLGRH